MGKLRRKAWGCGTCNMALECQHRSFTVLRHLALCPLTMFRFASPCTDLYENYSRQAELSCLLYRVGLEGADTRLTTTNLLGSALGRPRSPPQFCCSGALAEAQVS